MPDVECPRSCLLIEADLITTLVTARRCPHVMDDGRSDWDTAHRQLDQLLHEWRLARAIETAGEPA